MLSVNMYGQGDQPHDVTLRKGSLSSINKVFIESLPPLYQVQWTRYGAFLYNKLYSKYERPTNEQPSDYK
jgi:hypothetical protein